MDDVLASSGSGASPAPERVRPGVALSITEELARCTAEQDWIRNRADVVAGEAPAWLVTLGLEDWEMEKRLIMAGVA